MKRTYRAVSWPAPFAVAGVEGRQHLFTEARLFRGVVRLFVVYLAVVLMAVQVRVAQAQVINWMMPGAIEAAVIKMAKFGATTAARHLPVICGASMASLQPWACWTVATGVVAAHATLLYFAWAELAPANAGHTNWEQASDGSGMPTGEPMATTSGIIYLIPNPKMMNPDPTKFTSAPDDTGGDVTPKSLVPVEGSVPTFTTATTMAQVYALCDGTNAANLPGECLRYTTDGINRMEYRIAIVPSTTVASLTSPDAGGRTKVGTTTASTAAGFTKVAFNKVWGGMSCPPGYNYDPTRNECVLTESSLVKKPSGTMCEIRWTETGPVVDSKNPECTAPGTPKVDKPAPNTQPQNIRLRSCATTTEGKVACVYLGDVTDKAVAPEFYPPEDPQPTPQDPGKQVRYDDGTTVRDIFTGPKDPAKKGQYPVKGTKTTQSTGDPTGTGSGTTPTNPGPTGGGGTGTGSGGSCGGSGQPACKIDDSGFGAGPDGGKIGDATSTALDGMGQAHDNQRSQNKDQGNLKFNQLWGQGVRFGLDNVPCQNPDLHFQHLADFDMTMDLCGSELLDLWRRFAAWMLAVTTVMYVWRRFLSAEQVTPVGGVNQ